MVVISTVCAALGLMSFDPSAEARNLVQANNSFGIRLVSDLAAEQEGNTLVSPISVSSNLRLLLSGSRSQTQRKLSKALGLGEKSLSTLNSANRELENLLSASAGDQVTIANSIWVGSGIALSQTYSQIARTDFNAEVKPLAGPSATGAADVNSWVSARTKGRISRLFDVLPHDAVMVLANAVTFDGKWQDSFRARDTRKRQFFGSTGTKLVDTMSRTGDIEVSPVTDGQIIRLPYEGHTSLYIGLPTSGLDPGKLLPALAANATSAATRVHLFLPRFTFEDHHDLQPEMTKLGVGSMFSHADFSGISVDPRLGKVSAIVHKTYIKIDEEGTQAAAATGISISPTAVRAEPVAKEIKVDHPFALSIRDDVTGTILFVGVVRNLE